MGLVQREIEAAGLATVTLSSIPDLTAAVGVPRVAAIEYPQGQLFGPPGDAAGQTAVLRAALGLVEELDRPGVVDLPFEWHEPASRQGSSAPEPPPIAKLLKRKPWLLARLASGDIPD